MAENEFLLDDKERYIDNTRWRCPYEYKRILEKQHYKGQRRAPEGEPSQRAEAVHPVP